MIEFYQYLNNKKYAEFKIKMNEFVKNNPRENNNILICNILNFIIFNPNSEIFEFLLNLLDYKEYDIPSDIVFQSPLLHETSHMAGLTKKFDFTIEQDRKDFLRWEELNKIFKLIWKSEKYQKFINHFKYIDKFGLTAKERLELELMQWKNYEMIKWVKNNLNIEPHFIPRHKKILI